MKILHAHFLVAALLSACPVHGRRLTEPAPTDDPEIPVLIQMRDTVVSADDTYNLLSTYTTQQKAFQYIPSTVRAKIKTSRLDQLRQDPNILAVEHDTIWYPSDLYGMKMVQAYSTSVPSSSGGTASCRDPDVIKIGVIDDGLDVNHPDIPCRDINDKDTNCIGKEFGIDGDGKWHNPKRSVHGTHVAGIIGATSSNNDGVRGVIGDGNFCFVIGRVFGETKPGGFAGDIFEAFEWMVDEGVKVINMSLGSPKQAFGGDLLMKAAYEKGVLVFAAAGNEGTATLHYPASLPFVLSVAAVDADRAHADFSQVNSKVDLAAPGVDIISTYPVGSSNFYLLATNSATVVGFTMQGSAIPKDGLSGELVFCDDLGKDPCPGDGGHVCLISRYVLFQMIFGRNLLLLFRGEITFEEKALHCEENGGIAAVVFNHEPGLINGGLAGATETSIPVFEISQSNGQSLQDDSLGSIILFDKKKGLGVTSGTWRSWCLLFSAFVMNCPTGCLSMISCSLPFTGTSMASPHAAGVAAKIWRACPKCTNQQVEKCILDEAVDLGTGGRDDKFGEGLVQMEASYECLRDEEQCCEVAPTNGPSSAPTPEPTEEPTSAPTAAATPRSPTSQPTAPGWQPTLLNMNTVRNRYLPGCLAHSFVLSKCLYFLW